jgi:hypothetical protein
MPHGDMPERTLAKQVTPKAMSLMVCLTTRGLPCQTITPRDPSDPGKGAAL